VSGRSRGSNGENPQGTDRFSFVTLAVTTRPHEILVGNRSDLTGPRVYPALLSAAFSLASSSFESDNTPSSFVAADRGDHREN
jgi:hypothetical protein